MKTIAIGLSVLGCALIMLAWSRPAHADQQVAVCYVVDVATFGDRVHIHCGIQTTGCETPTGTGKCTDRPRPPGEPPYFAVETTSPMAASVVQSGLAALASKLKLDITYDDDPAGNPAGCLQQDCRRIVGVVVR